MLLRKLVSSVAQQLLCACIAADMRLHNRWCACVGQLLCANCNLDLWRLLFVIWYIQYGISYKTGFDIWRIKKFEVYRHRSRHEIGMWKCNLFGSGAIRCLFLILFRKNRVLTIKKKQKVWRYQEYCLLLRSEFEQTEKNGCDEDSNEWAYWTLVLK